MTLVGREVVALDKLESGIISPKSGGFFSLLAAGVLGTMSGGLLGETSAQNCFGMLDNAPDKSLSTSSSMLGLVTVSLGHSVTECREEIGIDNH